MFSSEWYAELIIMALDGDIYVNDESARNDVTGIDEQNVTCDK